MTGLPAKIVKLHHALARSKLPHAFGGALALAWCTKRARGTIDIDLNVFVGIDHIDAVLRALPAGVVIDDTARAMLARDGQARLWWTGTPVDIFLNTTTLHEDVMLRVCHERFADHRIPFLSCHDLAIFKAFFNRTRDWADLEDMHATGTLDIARVMGVLIVHLGADDERVTRLRSISDRPEPPPARM
jgi:hypothetical protein